jgi:hypothetical protein
LVRRALTCRITCRQGQMPTHLQQRCETRETEKSFFIAHSTCGCLCVLFCTRRYTFWNGSFRASLPFIVNRIRRTILEAFAHGNRSISQHSAVSIRYSRTRYSPPLLRQGQMRGPNPTHRSKMRMMREITARVEHRSL